MLQHLRLGSLQRRERIWRQRGGGWRVASMGLELLLLPILLTELIVMSLFLACCVAWWKLRGH